jgi:hypothetical protein
MDTTVELRDPEVFPDEGVLKAIFGRGYPAYRALLDLLDASGISHEWIYYRDVRAWLCRASRKKKTIIWMSACRGFLRATFYIPAAHIEGLYGLDISEETKERLRGTKDTGKSKGATFELRSKAVLKDLEAVMMYKMALK